MRMVNGGSLIAAQPARLDLLVERYSSQIS